MCLCKYNTRFVDIFQTINLNTILRITVFKIYTGMQYIIYKSSYFMGDSVIYRWSLFLSSAEYFQNYYNRPHV